MLSKAWDSLFKPKNKYSLEHLQYLHAQLAKNKTITEANKLLVIETLRSISELMIWGDQHNAQFFDFFLEKNILAFFISILSQRVSKHIKIQLIQTLSILIENIRSETSTYYLLSNNHLNDLIMHRFDFSDEELLAYYISFLKTISLKLNRHTIQFFFNERDNDFPLYSEAIKFFNHPESMVRIAVRTLTLNVYRVEDPAVRHYILDSGAAPYFSNIVWFLRDQCVRIDELANKANHLKHSKLDSLMNEQLDLFYYLSDIFSLRIHSLSRGLSDRLVHNLFLPFLVGSVIPAAPDPDLDVDAPGPDASSRDRRFSDSLAAVPRISAPLALLSVAQVFHILTHHRLLNALACALLHPRPPACVFESPLAGQDALPPVFAALAMPAGPDMAPTGNACRDTLFANLHADNEWVVLGTLCLLQAVVTNKAVHKELLEMAGVFPQRLRKTRRMLDALTGGEPDNLFEDLTLSSSMSSAPGMTPRTPRHSSGSTPGLISTPAPEDDDFEDLYMGAAVETVQGLAPTNEDDYSRHLVGHLLAVLARTPSCTLVTLQVLSSLIGELVVNQHSTDALLIPPHMAILEDAYQRSVDRLRDCVQGSLGDFLLELFEDEYARFRSMRFEKVLTDTSLLLPMADTPLSGVDLSKRLPSGEVEKTRRSLQTFFCIRALLLRITREKETFLPLPFTKRKYYDDQKVDMSNQDVIGCTVIGPNQRRFSRYIVVETGHITLVEPDPTRIGWAIVRWVSTLQSIQVSRHRSDPQLLFITSPLPQPYPFSAPPSALAGGASAGAGSAATASTSTISGPRGQYRLTVFFEDRVRCAAAYQSVQKGAQDACKQQMESLHALINEDRSGAAAELSRGETDWAAQTVG